MGMSQEHLTNLPRHIIEKFMRIVRRTAELENRPWHFGTSETLYRSEMFLLELIGEREGISVTEAADQLGITKGAVSQTLKKLDAKGLLIIIEAEHLCMTMTGIKKPGAKTTTSAVRGILRRDATRAEAMALIKQ